ncbi:MAG: TonB-dependent receptor [Candidatus Kapabacteria bacterium]|nr:TonB-dependent receptor [Candidatus Kapabacteria bacterium]
MKYFILLCSIFFLALQGNLFSQENNGLPRQTIKGKVVNKVTKVPIIGATVSLVGTKYGSYTAKDGSFRLDKVQVGRYTLRTTAVGFEPMQYNIVLNSGSELVVNIELIESFVQTDTIVVTAAKDRFAPNNEAALVSATMFTIDDAQRFAGSRMDVSRMAQNYAGVLGADDRRNDIIIRGGSPTELLWRLDGLDIPNPNHFATQGATGGPVSALNANLLDNSDFFTGAFPAEYVGKMSGVFDIKLKKGNNEKYEFLGEFGFNGFELGAQGPLPIEKSSFIANFRYSFLDLLDKIVDFGFAGIPRYWDFTSKFDIPINNKNNLSITAFLGTSDINILNSKLDTVYTGDFDIKNGTDIASLGINWYHNYSDKIFGEMILGYVYGRYRNVLDSITTDENNKVLGFDKWFNGNSSEGYYTLKYNINYSPNRQNYFSAGIETRSPFYRLREERFTIRGFGNIPWNLDKTGNSLHLLSFLNWNWRISENITLNTGIAGQYFDLSKKSTIEPRLGFSYKINDVSSINLGFGLHRQILPLLTYFYSDENKNLDFMQSIHYVAGYSYNLASDAIIKIEGYYKDISKAPIKKYEKDSWSFLNSGVNFGLIGGQDETYISEGTGRAYGAELSLIKNFANGYYLMTTASYVRQQYKGSDGILRFGAFDNQYILNVLGGYEIILSPSFSIEISGKYTIAGGAPYTPIDIEQSILTKETRYIDSLAYTLRNEPYSRLDFRIDFRNNFKGLALISYLSIENFLNTRNIWFRWFNQQKKAVTDIPQLGFFFVGGIRIEF